MADDLDVEELLEATYNKTGIKEDSQGDADNNNHDNSYLPSDEDNNEDKRRHKKKKHKRSRSRSRSKSRSPRRRRSRSRSPRKRSRSRSPRRRRSRSRSPRRRRSRSRSYSPRRRSRSRDRYRRRPRSRDRDRRRRSRSHDRGPTYDRRPYRPASPIPMPPPPPMAPPRRQRSPDLEPPSIDRDRRTVMCMQLSAQVNNKELEDFFKECGPVKEAHVIQDRQSRRSKGIAYVEFEMEASIPSALMLSGRKLFGVPIIIQPTMSEKNRLAAAAQNLKKAEGPKKVYVGSLHYNINEDMLKAIFSPFGQIDRITVMRDTDTNISRGYAFVDFRDSDSADKAIANLNGLELAGRAIKVGNITTGAENVMTIDSLDGEDSDVGVGMTPQSRMALMAKLAAGHNTEMPVPSVPNVPSVPTISSCFIITGMFDPAKESGNSWDKEVREDVLDECTKFGNVLHVAVDKFSQGNVYVKCHTPQVASAAMRSFNGRFYAGKQVFASLVNESTYHLKYPGALAATIPIKN